MDRDADGRAADGPLRGEIRALTGIRGAASAWVLLYHAHDRGFFRGADLGPLGPLVEAGYLGVDLFFVLSGFILTHTYLGTLRDAPARERVRYMVLRFARIWPVHALVLLAMAGWVVAGRLGAPTPWAGHRFRLPEFVLQAGLVHAWVPGRGLSWNIPSWSVSAEWFAYALFPLACTVLPRVRSAGGALAGAVLALLATVAAISGLADADLEGAAAASTLCLVRVAGEFLAGCLLCRAASALARRAVPWGAVAAAAAAGVVALPWTGLADPWIVFLHAALVLALAHEAPGAARWLASRPAVWSGRISYSLYLVHFPILQVLAWAGARDAPAGSGPLDVALRVALAIAVSVVVAWGATRWVEEPARRALRRRVDACFGPPAVSRGGGGRGGA